MKSLLGLHWIRTHPDGRDLDHIAAMQYCSAKLFEWHWSDADACANLLTVLPSDAYILARNHPLSEQKQDMWNDPTGTGIRHADDWADKVRRGHYKLPTDRSFFLGINEPDATSGDRNAIDIYTAAYLNRLREHGLRGGGFNFSTGHPRTVDGTGATAPDYTVFERSHRAIVEGHHIGVLHIYGTASTPCVPGHYDRLKACTWQDVEWVVGECGADEHVIGGGPHDGYLVSMRDNITRYCAWLDKLILGVNDPRIHSWEVFTYDFSHPWGSFNVREIRDALEAFDWQHARVAATRPIDTHLPSIGTQPTPQPALPIGVLIMPCPGTITQRWGENPADYARFDIPGHNGLDIANVAGTPIVAVAAGRVAYVGADPDYGNYVRINHPQLGFDSFYAHMQNVYASAGSTVTQGQTLGRMGSTGNADGSHLHLEFRLSTGDAYIELSGGHGKGRFDPEIAYHLLNRVATPSATSNDLRAMVKEAALEFGIDPVLFDALVTAESSYRPDVVSSEGAIGLAQLMPDTFAEHGPRIGASNIYNPRDNARTGAAYLRWLINYFSGDTYKALLAYNFGPGNIDAGRTPPPETVEYAKQILEAR